MPLHEGGCPSAPSCLSQFLLLSIACDPFLQKKISIVVVTVLSAQLSYCILFSSIEIFYSFGSSLARDYS